MNEAWVNNEFTTDSHRCENLAKHGHCQVNGKVIDCRSFMDTYYMFYEGFLDRVVYLPKGVSQKWINRVTNYKEEMKRA